MSTIKDSKQIDVLRFIYEEVKEHGYPPTVREICNAVGLSSTSTVHGHLSRLEKMDIFNAILVNQERLN